MSILRESVVGTQAVSREAVDVLSHARAEPAWLRQRRLEAWDIFQRLPTPGRPENRFLLDPATAEEWRRTDFSALDLSQLRTAGEPLPRVAALDALDAAVRDGLNPDELSGLLVQQEASPVLSD